MSHIPLATDVYEKLMPIFEIALGVYFQSSYYVAKRPTYKSDAVFFERFCYDYVSLFGVNILFLELEQLELITRKVFTSVSFNFDGITEEGGIQLRTYDCVEPAFTEDKFIEVRQKINSSEQQVKIEVVKARKLSEDDFIDKVKEEKKSKNGNNDHEVTQS